MSPLRTTPARTAAALLLLAATALLAAGCSGSRGPGATFGDPGSISPDPATTSSLTPATRTDSGAIWFVFNDNLGHVPASWSEEFARLGDAVVLVCHGGTRRGRWVLLADDTVRAVPAERAIAAYREAYPGRQVVLFSCNPDGHRLDADRVWYVDRAVWTVPGLESRRFAEIVDGATVWREGRGVGDAGGFRLSSESPSAKPSGPNRPNRPTETGRSDTAPDTPVHSSP